jgi:hypothetical protein
MHCEVNPGAHLDIVIPPKRWRGQADERSFATQGEVIHVTPIEGGAEHLVGVRFIGPRFQRVFWSESGL